MPNSAIRLGDRWLGLGHPVLIVAEIGNNHDGNIRQAEQLIRAAAEVGVDAVKFQTHIAGAEMLPSTPTPPHFDEPRFEFTKRMELSLDEHLHLRDLANQCGLIFFSSPFSIEAVAMLEEVGVNAYKVASGEVTNPPLLEAIAKTKKPVLLSTGMSALDAIESAVGILRGGGDLLVMQCTSTYPCPPENVDLRAMIMMGERFGCLYGLSDHTTGVWTTVAAVALGASAVEKHFTLSKRLYGPDHHASLEPEDMRLLVEGVREVEAAMGSGLKERDPAHDLVRESFEKSVVTRVAIPEGTLISASMLTTKRPGTGIPATRLWEVVGRRTVRPLEANALVLDDDLG